MSRILEVDVLQLIEPVDRTQDVDGSNQTVVVRLTDDAGTVGIGECDAPGQVVAALFDMVPLHGWSMDLRSLLIGQDPLDIAAIWERVYQATMWHGRRGLVIHALSAIDIALHDLVAKRLAAPVWRLMGGARVPHLTPYATIFPGLPQGRSLDQVMAMMEGQFDRALALGFRAVKMELLFEDLASDRDLVDLVRRGRQRLGPDITMMLDFGYRWRDWHAALWVLERIADQDIWFAEATLAHDDLDSHARLSARSPIRICGAEAAATRFEIREWIERGQVAVLQPDIGRAGGLTEMRRIADLCALHGVQCIPHGWKTGITATCGLHFQAACPNVPFIEYLHPQLYPSPLRQDLVSPAAPDLHHGHMALPSAPGLGITLNDDAVRRFRPG